MFLELPLSLPGLQNPNTGEQTTPDKVVVLKVLPAQIAAYHEAFYDNMTVIYLQNGQPFILDLPMKTYENKIKAYFDLVLAKNKLRKV